MTLRRLLGKFNRGSPEGIVDMGGDSCSEGRGFKSQHCMLGGHFSHIFVVKIVILFEKIKLNEKEAGDGTYKKPNCPSLSLLPLFLILGHNTKL